MSMGGATGSLPWKVDPLRATATDASNYNKYYSTNPESKLSQCLMSVVKKTRNGALTDNDNKMNQIISSLRIEVERGIGPTSTCRSVQGERLSLEETGEECETVQDCYSVYQLLLGCTTLSM